MKKATVILMAFALYFSSNSWAQTNTQPPAAWIAFQKEEHLKQAAFFKQLKDDREAFFKANPDAKQYLENLRAAAKARNQAWIASHPGKRSTN